MKQRRVCMPVILLLVSLGLLELAASESLARQRILSLEEKERLGQAQTILIRSLALTERGAIDSHAIRDAVAHRLRALGYRIAQHADEPHDVVVKVKCEERKTWLGPTRLGGDADSPLAPSRVWRGPACQITYHLPGSPESNTAWRREVRTPFADAMHAAQEHQANDPGAYAMRALVAQLKQDPFPFLLAAEWRHAPRLIRALTSPDTPLPLKRTIIQLLGGIPDPDALDALQTALDDPALAPVAATALGYHGAVAIHPLLAVLAQTDSPALAAAAVDGLGVIGTHHQDPVLLETFHTMLQQPQTDLRVKIAIVKALGKFGDQRSVPILEELNRLAWTDPSTTPDMQQLREALSWSLWQLVPEAHTAE